MPFGHRRQADLLRQAVGHLRDDNLSGVTRCLYASQVLARVDRDEVPPNFWGTLHLLQDTLGLCGKATTPVDQGILERQATVLTDIADKLETAAAEDLPGQA